MMSSPHSQTTLGSNVDLIKWSTRTLALIDDCRFAQEEQIFSKRFEAEAAALVQSETTARLEQELVTLHRELAEVCSSLVSMGQR